jgi:hypothetical protein
MDNTESTKIDFKIRLLTVWREESLEISNKSDLIIVIAQM